MRTELTAFSFQLTAKSTVPPSGGTGESASQGGVRAREPRLPAGTGESASQGGVPE